MIARRLAGGLLLAPVAVLSATGLGAYAVGDCEDLLLSEDRPCSVTGVFVPGAMQTQVGQRVVARAHLAPFLVVLAAELALLAVLLAPRTIVARPVRWALVATGAFLLTALVSLY